MNLKAIKKYTVLAVLFLLPVTFLLFLYPAKHNYNTLDVVQKGVEELTYFTPEGEEPVQLENQITLINFLGKKPLEQLIAASNLKELIYDKFKGFKKFQVVSVLPEEARPQLEKLKQELINYDELKYWKFVFGTDDTILRFYNGLNPKQQLDANLTTDYVFIVDKERFLRGRLDDRTKNEIKKNKPIYNLNAYNCIEVKELKDKLSEDLRILFTEYRQKRKGNFNSTSRRADDLKGGSQ